MTVDVLVFGGSGFTGEFVCRYLARRAKSEQIVWGICGRNAGKLAKVIRDLHEVFPTCPEAKRVSKTDITLPAKTLIADISDQPSLVRAFSQAKVVINCTGPFRFFGAPVVEACIAAKAHYVDISGEPDFLESMQHLHHHEASKRGLTMVGSCGFDSIPADIGALTLMEAFHHADAECLTVESVLGMEGTGSGGHYATWQAAVNGFANQGDLIRKRRAWAADLPKLTYKKKPPKRKDARKHLGRYLFRFPGSDASVVRRSMMARIPDEGEEAEGLTTPAFYAAYIGIETFQNMALMCVFGFIMTILAGFSLGRSLLLKYPRLFSAGAFSHDGPTIPQLAGTRFRMEMKGAGTTTREGTEVEVRGECVVRGPEAGYVATPIMVVESAFEVLSMHHDDSRAHRPRPVGWLTPAQCFRGSELLARLKARGVDIDARIVS